MVYMDYALIGNCQIAALVSSRGSLDWCCMPGFDSPSVFARILDENRGGHFALRPIGSYLIEQRYIRNTNVLETTFTGSEAAFRITDFIPRWLLDAEENHHAPHEIYRYVEVLRGSPEVVAEYRPRLDYARGETRISPVDEWTLMATHSELPDRLFLTTNLDSRTILDGEPIRLPQASFFILSYRQPVTNASNGRVIDKLQKTISYWRYWVKTCYLPKDYQVEIIRSALTLKMLVYEPTGAIIAAPTTSIPEIIGGNRNWDYRFCWLRDAYFIVEALLQLSRFEVVEGFTNYLKDLLVNRMDYLRPMFTIEGKVVPEEIRLDNLSGYRNSKPVHIGNNATTHFQNDVYGEMILALSPMFYDERVVRSDTQHLWEIISYLVEVAMEKFAEEDNGLWEFRNFPRHYTFSKLMCWAAVDRGMKIARQLKKEEEWRRWGKAKYRMRQEVLEKAWNPDVQAFTQAYGSPHLDASNLLMPLLGIIDPQDPRMVSTVLRSEEVLMQNRLAFRYTNQDDFGEPENAFTICTFWLIDALIMMGQKRRARRYFEHVLKFANHVGLFSEDIDPNTGELTGNFPQGYTHVAVINTAMMLAAP